MDSPKKRAKSLKMSKTIEIPRNMDFEKKFTRKKTLKFDDEDDKSADLS